MKFKIILHTRGTNSGSLGKISTFSTSLQTGLLENSATSSTVRSEKPEIKKTVVGFWNQ